MSCVGCTVTVENSAMSLHAHVEVDGDPVLRPGDRVRVHGAPIRLAFGQALQVRRMATIERATMVGRLWAVAMSWLGITELYEVSFSPGRAR